MIKMLYYSRIFMYSRKVYRIAPRSDLASFLQYSTLGIMSSGSVVATCFMMSSSTVIYTTKRIRKFYISNLSFINDVFDPDAEDLSNVPFKGLCFDLDASFEVLDSH